MRVHLVRKFVLRGDAEGNVSQHSISLWSQMRQLASSHRRVTGSNRLKIASNIPENKKTK